MKIPRNPPSRVFRSLLAPCVRLPATCLALASLLALPAAGTVAAPTTGTRTAPVLAAGGELVVAVAGSFGELFPDSGGVAADTPVLALEVQTPSGDTFRVLVPGTEDAARDLPVALLLESISNRAFLLLESGGEDGAGSLALVGFDGKGWAERIPVSDGLPVAPGTARIAMTTDAYVTPGTDGSGEPIGTEHRRTTFHVLWRGGDASGAGVLYAPVVVGDANGFDSHPAIDLSAFAAPPDEAGAEAGAEAPPRVLALREGSDDDSSLAAFETVDGRLASVELRLVPGGISWLAENARAQLIDVGHAVEWRSPEGREALDEANRSFFARLTHVFDAAFLAHLADDLTVYLEAAGNAARDLESLADGARAQLIDVGARMRAGELMSVVGVARAQLIDVGARARLEDGGGTPRHHVRLRSLADRPFPESGEDPRVFLSSDGGEALVAWVSPGGDAVAYRESRGAGWSTVEKLALTPERDLDAAFGLLAGRME